MPMHTPPTTQPSAPGAGAGPEALVGVGVGVGVAVVVAAGVEVGEAVVGVGATVVGDGETPGALPVARLQVSQLQMYICRSQLHNMSSG